MFKFQYLPGWLLLLGIGLLSNFMSGLLLLGGKQAIEASAWAVIIGLLLRTFMPLPQICQSGLKASETLLIWGIVLMGAALNLEHFFSSGAQVLILILVSMSLGLILIYVLGRFFSLSETLSVLLAVGTSICGGTAIAVTAPLIRAKQEETSYAVGTIALWGLIAILVYPLLGRFLGVSDEHFGLFAGTAIHSTPQVVGAGFIFSDLAGRTATTVKLLRNCFLAPLALLIGFWFSARQVSSNQEKPDWAATLRAFPWFLFGYFLMSYLNMQNYFTAAGSEAFSSAGKFLILLGMAGIGINTDLASFKKIGAKPLLVSFAGTLFLALCSVALIRILF